MTETSGTPINPSHYHFGIEPLEYMYHTMTAEQFSGFLQGNVIKYVTRHKQKNGVEDLRKAHTYLSWLSEFETTGKVIVNGKVIERRKDGYSGK